MTKEEQGSEPEEQGGEEVGTTAHDLHELLSAAANIKSAQLKARPGRQAWEASPDFLKQTAADDARIAAARKQPVQERLALCARIKQQGNDAYDQDASAALTHYTRALSVFVWFDRGTNRAAEDVPYMNTASQLEEGPTRDQVNGLLAAVFNNAASCLLKLQKPEDAAYAASKALEHDPYNVKALFRRAHAARRLGTTDGLMQAVEDLQYAQRLEPDNPQVRTTLQEFRQELLQQKRKDAVVYGSMFAGGGLYDDASVDAYDRKEDLIAAGLGSQVDTTQEAGGPTAPDVQAALHGMQHSMQQVQQQQSRRLRGNQQEPQLLNASPFAHVPWWAWALILLHLAYRIMKLFRMQPALTSLPWLPKGWMAEDIEHTEL